MSAVIEARGLIRDYSVSRGAFRSRATVHALGGVSFSLSAGRTLASIRVSSLASVDLLEPDSLTTDRQGAQGAALGQRPLDRRRAQGGSSGDDGRGGPEARDLYSYPHMFSGGRRQRIAIARVLMLRPKILVLDEPVSELDVSVRAQTLNLLAGLQEEFGLAYVFVSHDLSVVRHIADEVMVIYLGRAVELSARQAIFASPLHPYTQGLLSAARVADPTVRRKRILLAGESPSPFAPPPGCPFHTRCPLAFDRCRAEKPPLEWKGGRDVACWGVTE